MTSIQRLPLFEVIIVGDFTVFINLCIILYFRTVSSISEEDLIEVAPAFCKEKKVTGFQLITVKPDEN